MTQLVCYYCERGTAMREAGITIASTDARGRAATVTVHDRRGCLHVCWAHAKWRSTTSMLGGHSTDCAVMLAQRTTT
jgi:hypothetical protein